MIMNSESNKECKKGYSSRKVFFLLLICCAGAAYLAWIRRGCFAVPCLFHEVTGLQCPGCGVRVMLTVNSVPTPFSDSTEIVPFISSTIFFVMAMPRPVLPYLLFLLLYSAYKWVRNERISTKIEASAVLYCIGLVVFGIVRNLV